MSRVAYAALGKRGSFSRDTRYTAPPADAVPAAPTEDAAEQCRGVETLFCFVGIADEFAKPRGQFPDQAFGPFGLDVVVEHVGEQREDDRESYQVDKNRQEQNSQRSAARSRTGR